MNGDVDGSREPQDGPVQSSDKAVTEENLSDVCMGGEGASISDAPLATHMSTRDVDHPDDLVQQALTKETDAASSADIDRQDAVTEMGMDPAFVLLRLAVSGLRTRSKRTTAAAVKTEMQRLSNGGFHESEYGYESFRKFLLAAEKDGAVALQLPDYGSGQDAQVDLVEEAERGSAPGGQAIRRIRPDIWSAFIDYRTAFIRAFDLRDHRAVKFPTNPVPLESSPVAELRTRFREEPDRFLVIEPVGLKEQLHWMQEFTAQVEGPERPLLEEALREDKPLAAFSLLVRSHSALAERWNRYRLERVTRRVNDWIGQHGLDLDLHERSPSEALRGHRDRAAPGAGSVRGAVDQPRTRHSGASVEVVRSRVSAAVARMPLSELLQLRLPVEYMLDP